MTPAMMKLACIVLILLLVYIVVLEARIAYLNHELLTLLEVERIDERILTIHTETLQALHNRLSLSEETIWQAHRPLECEEEVIMQPTHEEAQKFLECAQITFVD